MKKSIWKTILFSSMAVLALSACANENKDSKDESNTKQVEQSASNAKFDTSSYYKLPSETVLASIGDTKIKKSDIEDSMYSMNIVNALYQNVVTTAFYSAYPSTDEEINKKIDEQVKLYTSAGYTEEQAKSLFTNEYTKYYLGTLKAAKDNFSYSKSDLKKFYDEKADKKLYPTYKDYTNIEEDYVISLLSDKDEYNKLIRETLKKSNISFNKDIKNLDKDFTTFTKMSSDAQNVQSTVDVNSIQKLKDSDVLAVVGKEKITVGSIRNSLFESSFTEYLSTYINLTSLVSYAKYTKEDMKNLNASFKKQYNREPKTLLETLSMKYPSAWLGILKDKKVFAEKDVKDFFKKNKNNKDYDYSNVNYKDNVVNITLDYIKTLNNVDLNEIQYNSVKAVEVTYYDKSLKNEVNDYLKSEFKSAQSNANSLKEGSTVDVK